MKPTNKDTKPHWSYSGETSPEHWAELEKNSCCGGKHQSPIDIIESDVTTMASGLSESDIHYASETVIDTVANNGHTIEYSSSNADNFVIFKQRRYDLVQFHFHSPSEHTINGIHYPMEMHIVHQSQEQDYVIFGILIEEHKSSPVFDFLENYLPLSPGQEKTINAPYHFKTGILETMEHFYYQGSLTTPPCTETANWFVFKKPITASKEQVEVLSKLMPKNNFRNAQPLNGRKVILSN